MLLRGIFFCLLFLPASYAQNQGSEQGYRRFETTCSLCHGSDGTGGEFGPNISVRLPKLDDERLRSVIHEGIPKKGMPAFPNLEGTDLTQLIGFLRTIKPMQAREVKRKVTTVEGKTLEGMVLSQTTNELALQSFDKAIHLLRAEGESYREVTSQTNWSSYDGAVAGNRFTGLSEITKSNVASVVPKWIFNLPEAAYLETTPLVVDGIMYVTAANECVALDAGIGRSLWRFQRPRSKGLAGGAGTNRGAAVAGDHLFMVSDDAHLLSINRFTGALEWDTEMADWRQNYFATSAPLAVNNLVIAGTAGGENGARGFLAAFDQFTGKEVWRFWTVPSAGEPGYDTWQGPAIKHGGAVTWFTGSFDADSGTVYWQTGNPGPDYNGDERLGDNLYSDCVLALDGKTGKLKWHYQFTPHDTHDWDAAEPAALIDTIWEGKPRKLLFLANRNGFFYVLDRTDGRLLLAKPFVKKLNWASGIGADGRPVLKEMEKAAEGTKVCPSQDGATNWYSTAYLPATGLYYFQTLEKCDIYRQSPAEWVQGEGYLGGSQKPVPGENPQKVLRALDPSSGRIVWQLPQTGRADTWGGVLGTATGVLFFGEDGGRFQAVDADNGKVLFSFNANQNWKASPMAYQFDGHEYIAVASGQTVMAFGLP